MGTLTKCDICKTEIIDWEINGINTVTELRDHGWTIFTSDVSELIKRAYCITCTQLKEQFDAEHMHVQRAEDEYMTKALVAPVVEDPTETKYKCYPCRYCKFIRTKTHLTSTHEGTAHPLERHNDGLDMKYTRRPIMWLTADEYGLRLDEHNESKGKPFQVFLCRKRCGFARGCYSAAIEELEEHEWEEHKLAPIPKHARPKSWRRKKKLRL